MSNLVPFIAKNDLGLEKSEVDRLSLMASKGQLFPLSSEKEPGYFLLYCLGDDLSMIAAKTNIPRDVIFATAINYRWTEKAKILNRDNESLVPLDLQKELVNTILVATVVAMQRELGDVIAGRKEAKECRMIPQSPASLEKLMAMVTALNAPKEAAPQEAKTVIHAQNVQVNQGLPPQPAPVESAEKAESRKLMLKELEDSAS